MGLPLHADVTAPKGTSQGHWSGKSLEYFSIEKAPNFLPVWLSYFGFLLDLKSFFTSRDGWLDYWYRELNNYPLKLTDAKMTSNSITRNTCKKFSFCASAACHQILLELRQTHRPCAYNVLNAYLLMCSFQLLCCLNLVKILDALWNIFGFFFNKEPICLYLRQRRTDEFFPLLLTNMKKRAFCMQSPGLPQAPKLGIK